MKTEEEHSKKNTTPVQTKNVLNTETQIDTHPGVVMQDAFATSS